MIYIVEDDDSIRELIVYTLKQTGFEARGFTSKTELFSAMEMQKPQVIILDVMLGESDGIAILKELRKQSRYDDIAIMMATAKGTEFDKVIGLDEGADDYLVKPFGMMELVARVKALIRRTKKPEQIAHLELGTLALNDVRHQVTIAGEEIDVTNKEFELLKLFLENKNKVLTREVLLSNVWGYDFGGESRTVDMHIKTLRQKLDHYGKNIVTVRGVGYKLEDVN